jgi:solute carrier family 25 carnitine/acylcarnitine transporter 20/29
MDYIYGGVSGACGVLISHPFDTLKTRSQNNIQIKYDSKSKMIAGLYKGIIPPIISVGIEKALVFGTYDTSKKYIKKHYEINNNLLNFVSGGIAGLTASFTVTPFEKFKILLQSGKNIDFSRKYLFKGLSATFMRETPGFAIYFTVYEYMKKKYYTDNNNKISPYGSFIFGGLSGMISWIPIYPPDRIKTIIQTNKDIKLINVVKNIYNKEGFRGFYKGFHYSLMRAIPLHAGTFMTFELIKQYIEK